MYSSRWLSTVRGRLTTDKWWAQLTCDGRLINDERVLIESPTPEVWMLTASRSLRPSGHDRSQCYKANVFKNDEVYVRLGVVATPTGVVVVARGWSPRRDGPGGSTRWVMLLGWASAAADDWAWFLSLRFDLIVRELDIVTTFLPLGMCLYRVVDRSAILSGLWCGLTSPDPSLATPSSVRQSSSIHNNSLEHP